MSFKIFKSEIKKLKTYSGLCAFKGLSNDTTLMQIQSGRTVPLRTMYDENKDGIAVGLLLVMVLLTPGLRGLISSL
jgi:hypothetical protein